MDKFVEAVVRAVGAAVAVVEALHQLQSHNLYRLCLAVAKAVVVECRHFAVFDNYLAMMLAVELVDIVDSYLPLAVVLGTVDSYYLVDMVTFAVDFVDSLDRCHFVASSFLEFRGFGILAHSMSAQISCT